MLATSIRQKDGIAAAGVPEGDVVGRFIARIEKTDSAFQRQLSKNKLSAIRNFYETTVSQPPFPVEARTSRPRCS